jgi:hypothetical protein
MDQQSHMTFFLRTSKRALIKLPVSSKLRRNGVLCKHVLDDYYLTKGLSYLSKGRASTNEVQQVTGHTHPYFGVEGQGSEHDLFPHNPSRHLELEEHGHGRPSCDWGLNSPCHVQNTAPHCCGSYRFLLS